MAAGSGKIKDSQSRSTFTIRKLPDTERPRERLQRLGPEALSTPEILALILRQGVSGESILETAGRLLDTFGGIHNLSRAPLEELMKVRGIGLAKACQIVAAFELINRMKKSTRNEKRLVIRNPEAAYEELSGVARGEKKEHFWAILLDTRNNVIKSVEISVGSLDTSIVHPRELFKEAIAASASSIIIAHNHPSGNPEASREDIELSKRLIDAGKLIGIEVIDHIIITDDSFCSLKREGLI